MNPADLDLGRRDGLLLSIEHSLSLVGLLGGSTLRRIAKKTKSNVNGKASGSAWGFRPAQGTDYYYWSTAKNRIQLFSAVFHSEGPSFTSGRG
jgi:hypothetical protein